MDPDRIHYSTENCSIARTLDIVGEKWTLLVLREAFYGVRRFADFHRAIGCARNILSARLRTLGDEGILTREPYQEPGRRHRFEDRLTEKGIGLFTPLVPLIHRRGRYLAGQMGTAPL